MDFRNDDIQSRTSKNKKLYDEIYNNTNYSNMVVIDDSNEIDINKIKKIIDQEKRPTREINNNYMYDSLKDYYNISEKEEEKRIYDINEVLKEAKNKRDIIEEANEKRKIENYKFNNLNLENELAKTRKVYNELIKEENELLNIMNTLTNIDVNIDSNKKMDETKNLALDMLEDFKEVKPKQEIYDTKTRPIVKQIDNSENDTKEYSTDTFMFKTKDFEGLKSVKDQIKKSNVFIKILIFVVTFIVIIICYYIINKFILHG